MSGDHRVLLAHGGGGRLSRELIDREILPRFGNEILDPLPDAALVNLPDSRLVLTTDSFVVQPLFFPGGCIGDLAVHGTVNDVAAGGGCPLYLTLALILEEGLSFATLRRVLDAVRDAARACQVSVITGDTKVVRRGQCDGLYINVTGVGTPLPGFQLAARTIRPGDAVLVSGPVGSHGMAVLAARESLFPQGGPVSDSAPVYRLVQAMQPVAESVRFLRDPTRGGLAASLHEAAVGCGFQIDEEQVPTDPAAAAAAEMLGISLLHSPSEGRLMAVMDPTVAETVLDTWRTLPEGRMARRIGSAIDIPGRVVMNTLVGGSALVDMPHGELLPRIC
ncbi:MAG: hydrogenase expression/formation protein HypE [Alphaproteobacteria bacterium]